ncbi:hypothetical protein SJI19_19415 [Acerihabitans sp. TG2]|uniref:hypothetical protein n=1 Tax=Acerihabitans sp. TG2 TaxID=3096008 RepID=UPI002B226AB3|nr:hypothetical protein [Acerihabitans sp. TG2]MEA9392677.1 hypothetical protein [Acerihabitans sp. TG2]
MDATAETERVYWQRYEKASISAPVEIDVNLFHDAAGLMYPLNWRSDTAQDTETFMIREMYCGNVTEIYVRIGARYFRMRNYSNLNHSEIVQCVKEVMNQKDKQQK